jgi:peptidylprolyl isomerase
MSEHGTRPHRLRPVLRRTRPALALVALLLPALVACGSSDSESGTDETASTTAAGLEGITFTGEVGESLSLEWDEDAELEKPEESEVSTLVEGDGEEIEDGDVVMAYLYVANGTTQAEVYSDYTNGAAQTLPNDERVGELLLEVLDGATYGSRVVALTSADGLFDGQTADNPLGLGDDDPVVLVADLVEEQQVSPTPTSDEAEDTTADSQPSLVVEGGDPVALDFDGIDEPALDTPVQRLVIEEGDGREVKTSDTVTVDYLGSTYDADAPFDGSFSRGEPLVSPLSGLIQGWAIGLEGVPVGSRVLLQIPPSFGYGSQGSGESIPPNSTLWFLIDVIAAE